MNRVRSATLAVVLLLLGACAAEVPETEETPLPLPPPAPGALAARAPGAPLRPGGLAQVPGHGTAEPEREAAPAAPAAPAHGDIPAVTEAPVAAAAPQPWRVVRDGTTGCAEAAPLRLARQGGDVVPRLLAEARAAGGCRTTFRVNEWSFEGADADLVRLRLLNGPPLTLWFLRSDVVAP